ncbi:MAG: ImmA/IrrE family metallo-endopeptidase [Thermoguttaceae bacterium]|jgi:hypothetical protein|nr:ImmA/IrrE family metallo-endopeptidase [Thermoguttaceae bacterium]
MLPEIAADEWAAALDAVAAEALAQSRCDGPPVNALAVARALGMTVISDAGQPGRGRYVRLRASGGRAPRPTIFLRPEARDERIHWAAAHEIGEHMAARVFVLLGMDFREVHPRAREDAANQFAGRLLLPTTWFAADAAACGWDLAVLKSRYATASHELIARRMLEFPRPAVISIFDQGRLYFRRGNLPGRTPPLSPPERALWREVHQLARPRAASAGPHTIRGWPIHEPGWKREILRVEVELWT